MTYIRLIRHGETNWNMEGRMQGWTDIPLNETGKRQAEKARERLQDKTWDLFITSSLARAKETAHILNRSLHLPMSESDTLRERAYGDVEGMLRKDRAITYPDGQYPGAETRKELCERVMGTLRDIQQQFSSKNIIITTHGGVINAVLTSLSDGRLGFDRTKINNLSFTDIEYINHHWHIHSYND